MPNHCQVAAYGCGIFYSQASILSGRDTLPNGSTAGLLAIIQSLQREFRHLVPHVQIGDGERRQANQILEKCWDIVNGTSRQKLLDHSGFGDCQSQLGVFRQPLSEVIRRSDAALQLELWFELGTEITNGWWEQNPPRYRPNDIPIFETGGRWKFKNETTVARLVEQLGQSLTMLLPGIVDDQVSTDLDDLIPEDFRGWPQVEAGYTALRDRVSDLPRPMGANEQQSRLEVVIDPKDAAAILDGTEIEIHLNGAILLQVLLAADGEWVSGTKIKKDRGIRASREKKRLPQNLQELVEAKAPYGFRIKPSTQIAPTSPMV